MWKVMGGSGLIFVLCHLNVKTIKEWEGDKNTNEMDNGLILVSEIKLEMIPMEKWLVKAGENKTARALTAE